VALGIPTINNRLSALVTGRVTENDGAGGLFFYDASDATSTNLGTVFKPAASDGRWLRQYSGVLNVKWFGAVGDGTTDDTAEIQAAVDLAATGTGYTTSRGIGVFLPKGVFKVSSTINLKAGVSVTGESRESSIITSFTAADVLKFDATGVPFLNQAISFEEFSIYQDSSVVASSGAGINLGSSTTDSAITFTLKNVLIKGTFNGLRTQQIQAGNVDNLQVREAVNDGYLGETPNNNIVFNNCYFRTNGRHGFNGVGTTFYLVGCASESNVQHGYYFPSSGGGAVGSSNSFISGSAEQNGGDGIRMEHPLRCRIRAYIVGDSSSNNGITLDGGADVVISETEWASTTLPSGYSLEMLNTTTGSYPTGVILMSVRLEGWTSGVLTQSSTVMQIDDGKIFNTQANATVTVGSDDFVAGAAILGETHGITILSGSDSQGLLSWGDANVTTAASREAQLGYDHSSNRLRMRAGSSDIAWLRSDGMAIARDSVTAEQSANLGTLIVGNTNTTYGITVLSAVDAQGALAFSDQVDGGGDTRIGLILYSHSTDVMNIRAGGANTLTLDANGVASAKYYSGSAVFTGPTWSSGTASPEGAVTAPVGSIFSRTDGGANTSFYVKETGTGNTGWIAK
jgi:hypothetical protein